MTMISLDLNVAPSDANEVERPEPRVLYERYVSDVSRWLAHRTGPGAHVEDLTQEVFIIAFRRLADFRGDASLRTWLYGITFNVARNHRRKATRRRWFQRELPADVESPGPGAEKLASDRQEVQLVARALDRLKDRERSVLIAHVLDGMSGADIAAVHDAKVETVWVWLHRARKSLAVALKAEMEASR